MTSSGARSRCSQNTARSLMSWENPCNPRRLAFRPLILPYLWRRLLSIATIEGFGGPFLGLDHLWYAPAALAGCDNGRREYDAQIRAEPGCSPRGVTLSSCCAPSRLFLQGSGIHCTLDLACLSLSYSLPISAWSCWELAWRRLEVQHTRCLCLQSDL